MQKIVSSADANRKFSEILRRVRQGHTYLITSHGRPVARIMPAGENGKAEDTARKALLKHLRAQQVVDVGRWTREELYERR